ncbi:MAG: L-2-hydroxyglutarate oxidase [Bacteroidota bacterium]|nr:L-2-hydroxyglutarate oxidase [Bacteroidota bacterium]
MKYDAVIIGGGIVGLACALKLNLARPKKKIIVLEKEDRIGKHQTGNNSGVIHSGIYYKPGSLKAKNCIEGYSQLLQFCRSYDLPFDLCGKIILASSQDELPRLHDLFQRGQQNGLKGIRLLSSEEIKDVEPFAEGRAAVFVPQTAIVDYKRVAAKYAELITQRGVEIRCHARVSSLHSHTNHVEVVTNSDVIEASVVVNCAGLHSDRIARNSFPHLDVRIIPFRGEYYKLKPQSEKLVRGLIYPVPDPAFPFLGVHFTKQIDGGVEAGPNAVLAYKREGYRKSDINLRDVWETVSWRGFRTVARRYWKVGVEEVIRSYSKKVFVRSLQKLVPSIIEDDLAKGGAGVRAQACHRDGSLLDDFFFVEDQRVVHVCNAPSPAATSSLSIGETIAQRAAMRFS